METSDLWLLRKEETMAYNREIFTRPFEVAYREWRANLLADATNAKETRDMGAANGQADLELSEMKNGSEPTGAENAATDGLADGEATTNQKMGGKKKGDGEEEHTLEKLAEKPIPPSSRCCSRYTDGNCCGRISSSFSMHSHSFPAQ